MKNQLIAALCLLSLLALVAADDLKPSDNEDGFKSLFNGKDLTGWKVNENPATSSSAASRTTPSKTMS